MIRTAVLSAVLFLGVSLAGAGSVLAAPVSGAGWAWGLNSDGELGNGTTTPYTGLSTPAQVVDLNNVVGLAAGDQHSLALRSDGTVWAWGNGGWGQLGQGRYAASNRPIQVAGLTGVVAIAAGSLHSLALKADGSVWAWGFNYYGQASDGTSRGNVLGPIQVKGLSGVKAIAAGGDTSLALKSDGTVWAWGYDGLGELGNGTSDENQHSAPVRVRNLVSVAALAAGGTHELAVGKDGSLWSWGDNGSSQLGAKTTTRCGAYSTPCARVPVRVASVSGVKAVAGGAGFTLILKADGSAWGWGNNGYGELGTGSAQVSGSVVNPVRAGVVGVVAIAAGASHSLWLRSDGTAWAAGYNGDGQLGDGTFNDSAKPVAVLNLTGLSAIAAGHSHSLALKSA